MFLRDLGVLFVEGAELLDLLLEDGGGEAGEGGVGGDVGLDEVAADVFAEALRHVFRRDSARGERAGDEGQPLLVEAVRDVFEAAPRGEHIDVFDEEAHKLKDIKWLGQGTIYPDVIESLSITGTTIKSHHNVGGLPEKMNLKLVEPLRLLFKDEVRRVGTELGMQENLIKRHPFPGPGLGIRILGDITAEKVRILQDADDIYMSLMREWGLYDKIWQAGAILLPIRSVGVMGDERTYENTVALRAVTSSDAMTADWAHLPYEFLAKVSNEIINKVKGVNRVVYDISSKPPSTIEWE